MLGTAPITILPTPAVRTPPHHTYGPGPALCSGGLRSHHVSRRRGRGRRSRRRPSSSGRHGRCCGGYHPPGVAWRRSEGPTGQGLVLVKAGAASEGRAYAIRGLRGRESTKEVWGVGSIVAGAVSSTSCTTSQVPTVSSQRSGWRSSDWSWRTRLRSQPLWGMAAWRRLARALWRSGCHLMPPYGGRVSGRAVCPSCRGVASSEAGSLSRVGSLPSSEAETRGAVKGLGEEPSSEAEIAPRIRGGLDGPHCVRGPRIGLL